MKNCSPSWERVAAFFDLDGTLLPHPSLERRLFRQLRYQRKISMKSYFVWLAEAARLAPRGFAWMTHANKRYLREVAASNAPQCIAPLQGWEAQLGFFPAAIERVAWHAREGHVIFIVSGTLEPLARWAARVLDRDLARSGINLRAEVCATQLEEKDGRCTGRILGEAMFGEAKARAVRRIARQCGFDLAACHAYGDSPLDRWMLAAVGHPAAVNASRRLLKLAYARGWDVLDWKAEKNNAETQRALRFTEKNVASEGQGNRG